MELIDRQAAIDRAVPIELFGEEVMVVAVSELKHIPAAQPEPGEWLEKEVVDEPNGKIITQWQSAKCSKCGRYHTTPYLYYFTEYPFCPNCGSPMRKGVRNGTD